MARPVVATRQPVAVNRPAPVEGMARPAAPTEPQIRKVEAAPRGQAQVLQRGARGSTAGPGNAPPNANNAPANNARRSNPTANTPPANNAPANAQRPPPPDSGRNATPEGAPGKPGDNPGNRPGMNVPRPGAPQNGAPQNGTPQNGMPTNGRGPGQRDENNQVNRPSVPNNAPPSPQNSVPATRPNAPDVNRPPPNNGNPTRDVPRPG